VAAFLRGSPRLSAQPGPRPPHDRGLWRGVRGRLFWRGRTALGQCTQALGVCLALWTSSGRGDRASHATARLGGCLFRGASRVLLVVRVRQVSPSPQFALAGIGLVCGILGAGLLMLPTTYGDPRIFRLANLLLDQGFLLGSTLGLGSLLFAPLTVEGRMDLGRAFGTGLLIVGSFFLEAWGEVLPDTVSGSLWRPVCSGRPGGARVHLISARNAGHRHLLGSRQRRARACLGRILLFTACLRGTSFVYWRLWALDFAGGQPGGFRAERRSCRLAVQERLGSLPHLSRYPRRHDSFESGLGAADHCVPPHLCSGDLGYLVGMLDRWGP